MIKSSQSTPRASESDWKAFDQELIQRVETIKVDVPRGAKVHSSVRVAGQAWRRKDSDALPSTRKYTVTVQPGGRSQMPGAPIWEKTKPLTCIDMDVKSAKDGDPYVCSVVEERSLFRQERLRRFQMGSHFPALVSPRIVPSWEKSQARQQNRAFEEAESGGGHANGQRHTESTTLTRLTQSQCRKQGHKVEPHHETPWFVTGAAATGKLISDRKPALYMDSYDGAKEQERESIRLEKQRRLPV